MDFNRKINTLGNEVKIDILETGDIAEIYFGKTKINQLVGNNINGSDTNLYLKIYENGKIHYSKMTGIDSNSSFYIEDNKAIYFGDFLNVEYTVVLSVKNNSWFFDIDLKGDNVNCEVVFGGAIMLAPPGNEPYTCQYIDTKVFEPITICNRHTINHNYIQVGSFSKLDSFSTDGYQFFGLDYRENNIIRALKQEHLESCIYQYEFNFAALQTEKINLKGHKNIVFYCHFNENKEKAVTEIIDVELIKKDYVKFENLRKNCASKVSKSIDIENVLIPQNFSDVELDVLYPNKILKENLQDELISFFTKSYSHIILPKKEKLSERATGHIIFNKSLEYDKPIIRLQII